MSMKFETLILNKQRGFYQSIELSENGIVYLEVEG